MTEGKVKFFNNMKNFGFIAGDDGNEYFVHGSALAPGVRITEGDRVSFTPAKGDRGLKAENVTKGNAGRKPEQKTPAPQEEEDLPEDDYTEEDEPQDEE